MGIFFGKVSEDGYLEHVLPYFLLAVSGPASKAL
jgi:hypothetical protein